MSAEEHKAIVLRYFLQSHNPPYDLDVIDETCSPAFAEGRKRWQRMERAAFPDKHFTIEDMASIRGNRARRSRSCTTWCDRSPRACSCR